MAVLHQGRRFVGQDGTDMGRSLFGGGQCYHHDHGDRFLEDG